MFSSTLDFSPENNWTVHVNMAECCPTVQQQNKVQDGFTLWVWKETCERGIVGSEAVCCWSFYDCTSPVHYWQGNTMPLYPLKDPLLPLVGCAECVCVLVTSLVFCFSHSKPSSSAFTAASTPPNQTHTHSKDKHLKDGMWACVFCNRYVGCRTGQTNPMRKSSVEYANMSQ